MKNFIKIVLLDSLFTIIDVTLVAFLVKMILASAVAWAILGGVAILCSILVQCLFAALLIKNRIRECVPIWILCRCFRDNDEPSEEDLDYDDETGI